MVCDGSGICKKNHWQKWQRWQIDSMRERRHIARSLEDISGENSLPSHPAHAEGEPPPGEMMDTIEYCYDKWGYTVIRTVSGRVVEEYNAGNNPLESSNIVPLDQALPIKTIRKYAGITAYEMAAEHGISSITGMPTCPGEGEI